MSVPVIDGPGLEPGSSPVMVFWLTGMHHYSMTVGCGWKVVPWFGLEALG